MRCRPASPASRAWSWWCRRRTASSIRWCWRQHSSAACRRSIGSAARKRWRRWPTAPRPSRRWARSSAPATPMLPPPSGRWSGRGAARDYGTATIAPVAKIVGPGNAYVAAAKRLVFGKVGIDMIAGPSEVLVISDHTGNAGWIAADLLAQAEHDVNAQSILITDNAALAGDVERAVQSQLRTLPRAQIARASWNEFGAIILVGNLDEAVGLANAIAAEHLEIMTSDPEALAAKIRNAGAIFLGPHTPEAIGDYVGGSNHVLPPARSARFSSGLGVLDFMKRTSILKCGPDQLRALGPAAMTLGKAEGLDAHARSVGLRLNLS